MRLFLQYTQFNYVPILPVELMIYTITLLFFLASL